MTAQIPLVRGGYLTLVEEGNEQIIVVGTPAWYAWLARATRFAFVGEAGSFTASRQQFGQSNEYWQAYAKHGGRLRYTWVGLSSELGLEQLEHVASSLARYERPAGASGALVVPKRSRRQRAGIGGTPVQPTKPAIPFLISKVTIPPVPEGLVPRSHLLDLMETAARRKLTLLTAPAGSGKTTLLSVWSRQQTAQVAWVALEGRDNDPVRFWGLLIAALEQLEGGISAEVRPLLLQRQPPDIEVVLTSLLHALLQRDQGIILVLDDYHLITHPAIHSDLQWLVEHLPPTLRVVLSSRADPPFSLARTRLQDQVSELLAADLRLLPEELASFFGQTHQLALAPEEQQQLAEATEGWIAGLQLAALAFHHVTDRASFLQAFTRGRHPMLVEYLLAEVLAPQPPAVQRFLLQSAILERLSGPLCELVTQQADGQGMLERLERAHLFVIPLDQERRWYRYHPLFAEFLHARLQREQPEQISGLHRRAARWYTGQGLLREAIPHALAAGDPAMTIQLVEAVTEEVLEQGEYTTLLEWLEALPPEEIRARPCLGVLQTHLLTSRGQLNAAEVQLVDVERHLAGEWSWRVDESEREYRELSGQIAAVWGEIAYQREDYVRAIDRFQEALELLPASQRSFRHLITEPLGTAYVIVGKTQASMETYITQSQASGDLQSTLRSLCNQGNLQVLQGRLTKAAVTFQQALQLASNGIKRSTLHVCFSANASVGLGRILYEWNEQEAAASHLQHGLEGSQQQDDWIGQLQSLFLLARLKHVQRDSVGFHCLLERMEQIIGGGRLSPLHAAIARARCALLWLASGNLDQAAWWIKTTGAQAVDPPTYPLEVVHLTLARVLLAQGHYEDVLPFLEQIAEAAASAERGGRLIECLLLQALAHSGARKPALALRALVRVLALAEPGGYIRLFADEGAPIVALLEHLIRAQHMRALPKDLAVSPAYLRRILDTSRAATRPPASKQEDGATGDALSEREGEVVRLLALGRSNQEIAEELVLELSTVKWHLRQVYAKLHLERRTQLVRYAQERGLV